MNLISEGTPVIAFGVTTSLMRLLNRAASGGRGRGRGRGRSRMGAVRPQINAVRPAVFCRR